MNRSQDDVSLMGLIRIIYRWRHWVALTIFGLPLITAVAVLFMPNVYTARGTILLETSPGAAATEILGDLSALTGLPAQASPAHFYLAILRSDRVGSAVIDSLDLADHFATNAETMEQTMEITLRQLHKRVLFDDPDDVTIHIEATDPDPVMAAAVVNVHLDELERANQTLSLSRARRTRRLVENALNQTQRDLEAARHELGAFQAEFGVFSLDEQTKSTLKLIATLQGQLVEVQTERAALHGFQQRGSAQLRNLDLRIEALQSQIDQLTGRIASHPNSEKDLGDGATVAETDGRFFLPLTRVPELTETYSRIVMNVEVLESKYGVLATRLEQTKIEESQSIPSFEILDHARKPFQKSGPNRTMYVLVALAAGVIAGVLLAVFLEDVSKRLDESTQDELVGMLPKPVRRRMTRSS